MVYHWELWRNGKLDEELSENGSYIENKNQKHNLDAKYGWYRYDSRFAIAIYNNDNEVERYNVYKVRMIIRCDADGKKYLYDMINIKKNRVPRLAR